MLHKVWIFMHVHVSILVVMKSIINRPTVQTHRSPNIKRTTESTVEMSTRV